MRNLRKSWIGIILIILFGSSLLFFRQSSNISNFINSELYGRETDALWSVVFIKVDNISRHPSQIYEAILEGVVLFILINFLAFKKQLILKLI